MTVHRTAKRCLERTGFGCWMLRVVCRERYQHKRMGTCSSDMMCGAASSATPLKPQLPTGAPSDRPRPAAVAASSTARTSGSMSAATGGATDSQDLPLKPLSVPQAGPGKVAWPTARQRLRAGVLRWMATRRAMLNGDTFQAEGVEDSAGDTGSRLQVSTYCHDLACF
jgi:hypothetical protein